MSDSIATALTFTVPGQPIPKGRPRVTLAGGKPRTYTPQRTVEYEQAVGWAFRDAFPGAVPLTGPVAVTLDIHEGGKRPADIDNYEKAVLDALNGLAFEDDKQVVRKATTLERQSAYPRVVVTVTRVTRPA